MVKAKTFIAAGIRNSLKSLIIKVCHFEEQTDEKSYRGMLAGTGLRDFSLRYAPFKMTWVNSRIQVNRLADTTILAALVTVQE